MAQALALFERADGEFTAVEAGVQSLVKLAWISATQYVAVWTDGVEFSPQTPQILGQIFDADGTPAGDSFAVSGFGSAVQTNAVVTGLAGGGFVIAWEDRNESSDGSGSSIRYQVFGADGSPLVYAVANTTTTFAQSRPSIAGLESGGFVITWTDDSRSGGDTSGLAVRGQVFTAIGAPAGSEFLVNSTTFRPQTGSNVVALPDGGFAVVWEDDSPQGVLSGGTSRADYGSNIAIQIFDSAANKVGPERVVDDTIPTVQFSSSETGRVTAHNPVAAVLPNGNIAVTWIDAFDTSVKTRQLNPDGTPATAVEIVGDASGAGNPAPSIVVLPDGGYAISWTSTRFGFPDEPGQGVIARVYGADGSPQGLEFQVNSTTQGNQLGSSMLAFSDGGFLVAWQDDSTGDISGQRFREDAGTISDIALSVPSISRAAIENVQAAVLSADGALNAPFTYQLLNDPTGAFRIEGDRLVVADTQLLYGFGAGEVTLTFRVTDPNGNSFDEAILIPIAAAPADVLYEAGDQFTVTAPSAVTVTAQSPELLALPDGGYFMVWSEARTATGTNEIMGQFYEADGSHGQPFMINTLTAGSQLEATPALLANGNVVVTWAGPAQANASLGTQNDVRAQILDSSGAKVGSEFVVNTVTAFQQFRSVATALADGGFLITWSDFGQSGNSSDDEIKAQIFTAAGAKVGEEVLVNATTAGAQTNPYAAQLASGTIVVAWNDASATGGDASGTAIRARLLNPDGTPIGGEFLVNTTTLHSQLTPVVTALSDGRFVIVWGDTSEGNGSSATFDPADIRAQIFDANGNRLGDEILVNSETYGFQGQGNLGVAGVAADDSGGFVVTWGSFTRTNSDEESGAVKAQLFGADGAKVGGEFLVNQIGDGQQSVPAVTYLGDDDLVFAWWDVRPDGARTVAARRFDAAVQATAPVGGTPANDTVFGTSEADVMAGYGGNDILRLEQGGEDRASGGPGNDIFYFGTALSSGDVADGGDGRDAIVLQGNATVVLTDTNLVGIESISIQSGANAFFGDTANAYYDYDVTTADGNVAAGQQMIVNAQSLRDGEDFTFDGSAETDGKFLIYGGHGVDDLTGGDGADVFFFEGQRWSADDRVDGGGGRDSMVISAGNGLAHIEFGADSFTNIESISLNNLFASDPSQKPSYELVLHNGNVAPGATLIVNGNSIPLGQVVNIDGSAVHDGKLTLFAGGGHDIVTGGDGNDLIFGGGGQDSLSGGVGADIYRYDSVSDSAAGAHDVIGNFDGFQGDRIDLGRIDANSLAGGDQAFTFIGVDAFSGMPGQLRFRDDGGFRWVEGDINGDALADFALRFYNNSAPQIEGHFIL